MRYSTLSSTSWEDRLQKFSSKAWAQYWLSREPEEPCPELPDSDLPSSYGFRHISECKSKEVNAYCRTSSYSQDIRPQAKGTEQELSRLGFSVNQLIQEPHTTGKTLDREGLKRAVELCLESKVPLVVPCFSRLLRSKEYHAFQNPAARPGQKELEGLVKVLQGTDVYCLNGPDASPEEDERFLARMSATSTGVQLGRPKRHKRRKQQYRGLAKKMRDKGASYREIAAEVSEKSGYSISKMAICKWFKNK